MATSVSKMSNTGMLYETETQRLQKGLDDYTKQLEKEKRYHPHQTLSIPRGPVQTKKRKTSQNEGHPQTQKAQHPTTEKKCRHPQSP